MCDHSHHEESPVVLDQHQSDADDGRAVLDPHVSTSLPLQQVRPKDHSQVRSCHLVTSDLEERMDEERCSELYFEERKRQVINLRATVVFYFKIVIYFTFSVVCLSMIV